MGLPRMQDAVPERREPVKDPVFSRALKTSLPVMAGYIVLGMGFGMVLQDAGYSVVWALIMSVFIYAGSMQFVMVNLMTGGASLLTVALTTLLVNARHLFYGISMVDRYKNTGKRKPYLIFALTDETYSLLSTDARLLPREEQRPAFYFLVSFLNQCYWVTGSVLGALLGEVLPISTRGIDFSLTALFLTIVVDQWHSGKNHLFTGLGFVISIACLLIFGPDNFLIPSMLIIMASVFLVRGREGVRNG